MFQTTNQHAMKMNSQMSGNFRAMISPMRLKTALASWLHQRNQTNILHSGNAWWATLRSFANSLEQNEIHKCQCHLNLVPILYKCVYDHGDFLHPLDFTILLITPRWACCHVIPAHMLKTLGLGHGNLEVEARPEEVQQDLHCRRRSDFHCLSLCLVDLHRRSRWH